ncbi:hypothetical protein GDO81_002994 [Engystomops pustulosus]|uniref:Uncharacterized protein n=1 Tax=Engystomops pustulosus TaxID=76066 RepID=A0AAV7DP27_ENGPU|nr:hypothetical protein GDO81_002994 [Engystomops pustulosus]
MALRVQCLPGNDCSKQSIEESPSCRPSADEEDLLQQLALLRVSSGRFTSPHFWLEGPGMTTRDRAEETEVIELPLPRSSSP